MAILSDLAKHKDDPSTGVTLSSDLQKQLRASLQPQRDGMPTTAIHQRFQAMIDTSRSGSADVAKAVTLSGEKVQDLGLKLDGLAQSMGNAAALNGRIDTLQRAVEDLRRATGPTGSTAPTAPDGHSNHPPKELSDEQFVCLRALAQIDAQLADKDTSAEDLSRHLDTKLNDTLGKKALKLLESIGEGDAWIDLCARVDDLSQVPRRVSRSYILRGVILRSFLLEEEVSDAL